MSVPLYETFIPMYLRGIDNMVHILQKGEAFAKEKDIPESEVMGWRIVDDMLPLTFQVQTVCNNVKNTLVRVTGKELPAVEDNEKTFAELYARLKSTRELLASFDAKAFEGKADAEVVLPLRSGELKFSGLSYLQQFSLPNFYFHITTLYNIFRARGAPLGKMDFLRGSA